MIDFLTPLRRGFSLLSAYQKATTKTVVANFKFTANFADSPVLFLGIILFLQTIYAAYGLSPPEAPACGEDRESGGR